MKHLKPVLLSIALISAMAACKKDEPAEVDLGYDYFPQNIGHWIEYQVDSSRSFLTNAGNPSDIQTNTWSYQLREVLVENITDGEGRPAQRIIRYLRDPNGNWQAKDVWWQTRDNVRAERAEENQLRVKLIFPPRVDTEWNMNAGNTEAEFGLTYEYVDEPYAVNGFIFDKTLSVVSTFENNPLVTKNYRTRYAKGVGVITFEMDSVDAQPSFQPGGPQYTTYDRWMWKYTLTAYGN